MSDKPIGLLGGTFDPVHHGHLRLALECIQVAGLTSVSLIPLHTPPHRGSLSASPEQRLRMLQLATENIESLQVDDIEIKRGGTSWSIDTVRALRQTYGTRPLCLIMGMDAFQTINTWKQWDLLLDHVHIIVTDRPDTDSDLKHEHVAAFYAAHSTNKAEDIHTLTAGKIYKINIPLLAISSTGIRQLFVSGQNPAFLLPDNVISYIHSHNIYTGPQ
jgi:nicotinate-nucleotide adenylyltransferase